MTGIFIVNFFSLLGRFLPRLLWESYNFHVRYGKIKKLYCVLSFDCDTDDDALAAASIFHRFENYGLSSVWAVPGELIERNYSVYSALSVSPYVEFINHGGLCHTKKVGDNFLPCRFYHELTRAEIEKDVLYGHEAVSRLPGQKVQGLRIPHFGTFQRRQDLQFVYDVLIKLGYRYSTSTLPVSAYQYGPLIRRGNLYEIPLSGCYDYPLQILDSWDFFKAPQRVFQSNDYFTQFEKLISFFMKDKRCGILNFYVDPSHVSASSDWWKCVDLIREMSGYICCCTYRQLLDELEGG